MYYRIASGVVAGILLFASVADAVSAPPEPGTVVLNRSRVTSKVIGGSMTIEQKIGPFDVPVHVFLTAYGKARSAGGNGSLKTTISFGDVTHSANGYRFELPDGSLMEATANFDFILGQGQTTIATATTYLRPDDSTVPRLRLFYKAISVECLPSVC